jgi:hypothetical protein
MGKPKVTATDQLSNVIEVVELGQRTGMLLVERGSGSVLEEGEIYFVGGRAVYASLAGLRGREALSALGRWGACRFAFDREALRPDANLTNPSEPAIRAVQPQSPVPNARPSWPSGGSQPGYPPQRGFDGSGSWPMQQQGARPMPPQTAGAAYNGQYSVPAVQPDPQTYAASASYPPLTPPPAAYPGQPAGYRPAQAQPGVGTLNGADPLRRRPRRAPDVRDLMNVVTAHNLSRSHRTVLLLSDGEHTVEDLSRLSSKSLDEVAVLLDELETRGLVYYYN